MATVKPIKPEKAVDYVAYEPVMIAVSKARAMAWVLEELGADETSTLRNNLVDALKDAPRPEDTRDWLQSVVAEALHAAHDEIEREYRKLGTNLLMKEAAATLKPTEGA
jgi:hypothetical protein